MEEDKGLVSSAEFNRNVKKWSSSVRNKMIMRVPRSNSDGEHIKSNTSYYTKQSYGVIWKTAFRFPKQGIYIHYGVGRGFTRSGGMVVRGKSSQYKRKKDYNISNKAVKGRLKIDWFNKTISDNIGELADYTQEYYGDEAQKKLIAEFDRMIIKSNRIKDE